MSYDSILIATDGSDFATHAPKSAIQMADAHRATLHVLCVIDSRILESAPHLGHVKERALNVLDTVQKRVEHQGHCRHCDSTRHPSWRNPEVRNRKE